MFPLTRDEIYLILEAIRNQYGPGYSSDPAVGKLQAKLSMMGEMASQGEKEE